MRSRMLLSAAMIVVLDESTHGGFASAPDTLVGISSYLDTASWALLLITILDISVMLCARIDHRRERAR
jgi:hypothetical protein